MSEKPLEKKTELKKTEMKKAPTTIENSQIVTNLLKKGDYTVHILIEEIKNITSKIENQLPQPCIKLTCFEQTKRTTKPDQVDSYTYNEHFYFDKTDLTNDYLDSAKILIEAYDYHNSKREDYFGMQEFDFGYIYSLENHAIRNMWIALANPESKDICKINGYLKLSICILCTEDEKVELLPTESDGKYFIPPQIKTEFKQLQIYIFKGEQFPDMDNTIGEERKSNKRCNGYVIVNYLGITKKTNTVDMKNDIIEWNQLIELPIQFPVISKKVIFKVFDENKIEDDCLIGSFEIIIDDIISGKYNELTCVNIYGTLQAKNKSKAGKLMNSNPEMGSRWKGRIFIKINCNDVTFPIAGIQNINDYELIEKIRNTSRAHLWSLNIKLFSAEFLPKNDEKYGIKLCVENSSQYYDEKNAINRCIEWNQCCTFAIQSFTKNVEELPDLFIYLTSGKKQICFQRLKLSKFRWTDETFLIKLFPEPCVNKVKSLYFSGLVKLRIKLFNRKEDPADKTNTDLFKNGDESGKTLKGLGDKLGGNMDDDDDLENYLNKNDNVEEKTEEEPQNKNYTIVACVYMSRYLIAGDDNGLSDPYTEIRLDEKVQYTSIKNQCANGIWNEKLIFKNVNFKYNDKSTWPIMQVTVLDKDENSCDILGYSYVWLCDTNYVINSTKKIAPKWQQLYLNKSNRAQGQLLLSFYIFDEDHENEINKLQIEPETTQFNVEINALGLRDLKPLSFVKIKKPYISFDLNSINISNKGETLQPIKTMPNESGNNPNINSVIKFSVNLPVEEIFMPEFQCDIHDTVLGGLSQKLLGVILINVRNIISETKRLYKLEIDNAEIEYEKLKNKKNNEKYIDTGMSEKDENQDNLLFPPDNEDNDINIKDSGELAMKSTMQESLITTSQNRNINLVDLSENSNLKSKNTISKTFKCYQPSDLNYIYKGKIDNNLLDTEKDNSEYFVIKPSFVVCDLPKKFKNEKNSVNKENLIENSKNVPDINLYFPIGFNRNENPMKISQTDLLKNNIVVKDDEKKGLVKNNEYNQTNNNKKHYRRIYRTELEKVQSLNLGSPFINFNIYRNKYNDEEICVNDLLESMKSDENKILKKFDPPIKKKTTTKLRAAGRNFLQMKYEEPDELLRNQSKTFDTKNYGTFKCLIRIAEKSEYEKHEKYINNMKNRYNGNLPPELSFLTAFNDYCKEVLVKRNVVVRLYILELNNLAARDTLSESDPYIKILLGEKELVNEKKNYYTDQKNCKWYKHYDLLLELPGSSKLKIQVLDYDNLFSDDLIGETEIDIEDRYFDNRWQALTNKPIEIRKLYHPDYKMSQGELMMWLEIYDKEEIPKMEPWNIEPEPINKLECRLIIYETENMENLDVEDTSDIYVLAFLNIKEKFSTDIHYRCSNGQASFNYRLKIPVETPRDNYELNIQAFDNDILTKDEFLCGARLNLINIIKDVNSLDFSIKFTRDYYSNLSEDSKSNFNNIEFLNNDEDEEGIKFWVQCEKNGKKSGRILCSLEILPEWYSNLNEVGSGRNEPNVNPYLPPPVGRITFTLNPVKMLNQFTGPKFRKKFYCLLCWAFLVIYLVFVLPYIIYFISGEIFNPFNYIKKKVSE